VARRRQTRGGRCGRPLTHSSYTTSRGTTFETTLIACGPFSSPKITAKPRERDRWFESALLQRGVSEFRHRRRLIALQRQHRPPLARDLDELDGVGPKHSQLDPAGSGCRLVMG
jgi:hypothetical protein